MVCVWSNNDTITNITNWQQLNFHLFESIGCKSALLINYMTAFELNSVSFSKDFLLFTDFICGNCIKSSSEYGRLTYKCLNALDSKLRVARSKRAVTQKNFFLEKYQTVHYQILTQSSVYLPESNYWFSIDSLRCSIFEDLRESKEAY